MNNQQDLIIKIALDSWHTQIKRSNDLFASLTDEQLQNEVSPGRNRGVYLLGHLAAVHDRMIPLLSAQERFYPGLDNIFLSNPDKTFTDIPSTKNLRESWEKVNTSLATLFANLNADDWFQKHNSVSEEDFLKEPHRNKLSVLINRTNHLSYHFGQLAFLKK